MPLIVKGDVTQNSVGNELYIEVLNATGSYNVSTNPGGFGTPNPARNSLALVLVANHKLSAEDQPASIQSYNPLSVTSFTVNISKAVNGVLQWNVLAIPIFDSGGSYSDGAVVYDNENPTEPFIKERVAGVWTPRDAEDIVGNVNVSQANEYSLPVPDAMALSKDLLMKKQAPLRDKVYGENDYTKQDFETADSQYKYVDLLLNAACDAFRAQAYNESQLLIEEIFNYQSQALNV
jgi:hypothetical protein